MQFINNMRGIVILLIIFTHSILAYPRGSIISQTADFVIGNGTILFVFLAGYLFSQTEDKPNFHYGEFLKNKILTVLMPYLFISVPATLVYILHIKNYHIFVDLEWLRQKNVVFQYVYLNIFGAQLGPLWFVPMIFLFYVMSPLFYCLRQSNWIFVLFSLLLVFSIFAGRPYANSNPVHSMLYFMPAYLLGMISFRFRQKLFAIKDYVGAVFFGYIVLMMLTYLIVREHSDDLEKAIGLILYMPLSILLILLCSKYLNKRVPVLDMFARLSFYLFFVHGYLTGAMRTALAFTLGNGEVNYLAELAAVSSVFVLTLTICLVGYVVLKLILQDRSRFFIGG